MKTYPNEDTSSPPLTHPSPPDGGRGMGEGGLNTVVSAFLILHVPLTQPSPP
jgi:hypothetical protein